MALDFTCVTELPGIRITEEQCRMMYQRYRFASSPAKSEDVLEVACGGGQGLGYLARNARSVVGGDYTESSVRVAKGHYDGKVPLLCLDAQRLPFRDQAFSV